MINGLIINYLIIAVDQMIKINIEMMHDDAVAEVGKNVGSKIG